MSVAERLVVVTCDESGTPTGRTDKSAAHRAPGQLHLAFSVVLFDGARVLLQQRAASKYHFPLFWANACCSHPGPGEDIALSAERRVVEELGVSVPLRQVGSFTYRATCPVSGLVEHEFDHVFVGELADEPHPEPTEVERVAWVDIDDVLNGAIGGQFTPWLLPALELAERARQIAS